IGPDHFRMNKRRPAILATVINRAAHYRQRFNRIGAVTALAIKIRKTGNEFRDVAAGSLHFDGDADRVTVVLKQEHNRQPQITRGVERFPKLAFTGGAVSE